MKKSPERTDGGQVIHRILWNSNSGYVLYKNVTSVRILSYWIQLTAFLLILYSHLPLDLRSVTFPLGYPFKILELLTNIPPLIFIIFYIRMAVDRTNLTTKNLKVQHLWCCRQHLNNVLNQFQLQLSIIIPSHSWSSVLLLLKRGPHQNHVFLVQHILTSCTLYKRDSLVKEPANTSPN